jgi:hypothetical protein
VQIRAAHAVQICLLQQSQSKQHLQSRSTTKYKIINALAEQTTPAIFSAITIHYIYESTLVLEALRMLKCLLLLAHLHK